MLVIAYSPSHFTINVERKDTPDIDSSLFSVPSSISQEAFRCISVCMVSSTPPPFTFTYLPSISREGHILYWKHRFFLSHITRLSEDLMPLFSLKSVSLSQTPMPLLIYLKICTCILDKHFLWSPSSAKKRNRHKKGPVEVIDADKAEELNLEDGDAQGARSISIQVSF